MKRLFVLLLLFSAFFIVVYNFFFTESSVDSINAVLLSQMTMERRASQAEAAITRELEKIKLEDSEILKRIEALEKEREQKSREAKGEEEDDEDESENDYEEERLDLLSDLIANYYYYLNLVYSEGTRDPFSSKRVLDNAGENSPAGLDGFDKIRQEQSELFSDIRTVLADMEFLMDSISSSLTKIERNSNLKNLTTLPLILESSRLNIAISWLQVKNVRKTLDEHVRNLQKLIVTQGTLNLTKEDFQGKINALQLQLDYALNDLKKATKRHELSAQDIPQLDSFLKRGKESGISPSHFSDIIEEIYWNRRTRYILDKIRIAKRCQQAWEERYEIFRNKASSLEMEEYRDNARASLEWLHGKLHDEDKAREISNRIKDEVVLSDMAEDDRKSFRQAMNKFQELISELFEHYQSSSFLEALAIEERIIEEASAKLNIFVSMSLAIKYRIYAFWMMELWTVDGYSVTVGNMACSILIFAFGYLAAFSASRLFKRVLGIFVDDTSINNGAGFIVFFTFWFVLALVAFKLLGIPMQVLSFIWGGIAIGLGFGSRHIFKNLFSGIIIIFSCPFRINDVIESNEVRGTIQSIGPCATKVVDPEKLNVAIVPNSYFAENKVVVFKDANPQFTETTPSPRKAARKKEDTEEL